jgi:hypothetical protein
LDEPFGSKWRTHHLMHSFAEGRENPQNVEKRSTTQCCGFPLITYSLAQLGFLGGFIFFALGFHANRLVN